MSLISSIGYAQSLADTARENRQQKAKDKSSAAKVINTDDLSASPDAPKILLVPGTTSTGQGTLLAPGRGKHKYLVTNLDATRFVNGGLLHIQIEVGSGASEASFDLYSEGASLQSQGFPNPLASAHNVPSGGSAKIDYRFSHGSTFQFAAEGSWNATAGNTNTYNIVVDVVNR